MATFGEMTQPSYTGPRRTALWRGRLWIYCRISYPLVTASG
jgi:hypothetical protein